MILAAPAESLGALARLEPRLVDVGELRERVAVRLREVVPHRRDEADRAVVARGRSEIGARAPEDALALLTRGGVYGVDRYGAGDNQVHATSLGGLPGTPRKLSPDHARHLERPTKVDQLPRVRPVVEDHPVHQIAHDDG